MADGLVTLRGREKQAEGITFLAFPFHLTLFFMLGCILCLATFLYIVILYYLYDRMHCIFLFYLLLFLYFVLYLNVLFLCFIFCYFFYFAALLFILLYFMLYLI